MSTLVETENLVVKFSVTDARIEKLREECSGLTATTKDGYERVCKALRVTCKARTEIEAKRVELKKDALDYGRRVDNEAKRLKSLVVAIEEPLLAEKEAVDAEARQIKEEAELAEKAKAEAIRLEAIAKEEAGRKAIRDAEDARLMLEREQIEAERAKLEADRNAREESDRIANEERITKDRIERERIEAEQKLERDRLNAERVEFERQRKAEQDRIAAIEAEQKKESDRLRAIQDDIEAKRKAREQAEFERVEAMRLEQEAAANARAERIEAERMAKIEAEQREALRPDVEKINGFAETLRSIGAPAMTTERGRLFISAVKNALSEIADDCESFGH